MTGPGLWPLMRNMGLASPASSCCCHDSTKSNSLQPGRAVDRRGHPAAVKKMEGWKRRRNRILAKYCHMVFCHVEGLTFSGRPGARDSTDGDDGDNNDDDACFLKRLVPILLFALPLGRTRKRKDHDSGTIATRKNKLFSLFGAGLIRDFRCRRLASSLLRGETTSSKYFFPSWESRKRGRVWLGL